MAGRLRLVLRLLLRDLRRRPTETVLLLVAIAAATGTLTLGLALDDVAARPYEQTRSLTAGPDVVLTPRLTGDDALAQLAAAAGADGVAAHSGPFPIAFVTMTAAGKKAHTVVEGRDGTPVAVDRPALTDGGWVRPGGVVVERAFADALGVRVGDTVAIEGRDLRVLGIAVTAARPNYPYAGWHHPGSVLVERGGLVWVDTADLAALTGGRPLQYELNLRLTDRQAAAAYLPGDEQRTWLSIADSDARLYLAARTALLIGAWLLAALALAGVAGIVAGRVVARRRRVGLLKAVGAGPAMIAVVHLAEYLVIGLAAGGAGLTAGWFAAPVLVRPGAGLVGSTAGHPPALRTAVAAVALALGIAVAATIAPVIRAAVTSTVDALADAPAPPRRRDGRIRLSRRLPTAVLLGLRLNARRPRRARLVTFNTLVTTTALVAILIVQSQAEPFDLGYTELVNPRVERGRQALLVLTVTLCVLALVNTAVNTWTAVLDARRPLAVARTLGATPGQAAASIVVAQLLPAVPGMAGGTVTGVVLAWLARPGPGGFDFPPGPWLLAAALGMLLAIAAMAAVPALVVARRPVAGALSG
ncbi:FtsX-like permease family protein [Dactylosporangium sp. CA-139066]|uniref:FtsX-like permease family protein n=1 Tax=Dactylosporangium sp. CA-139066 TaxID=3239930 RepID=UPI003D8E22ED